MTRSTTAWLERKVPDWRRSWSTSVVLPWSTWAMMAILRIFSIRTGEGEPEKLAGDRLTYKGFLTGPTVQAGCCVIQSRSVSTSGSLTPNELRHPLRRNLELVQRRCVTATDVAF